MSRAGLLAIALLAPALALGCGTPSAEQATEAPAASAAPGAVEGEVSMVFDAADVRPFLQRVARRIDSGFGDAEIAKIEELIRGLDVEEDGQLDFTVLHRGHRENLTVAVRLLDVNAPDLHFLAAPALAAAIDQEMKASAGARR